MALVDVPTAKRELRVNHSVEDADLARKLNTAQEMVEAFLGRGVYETQETLDAAIAAAPAALAAASTAYESALDAARSLTVEAERELGESVAVEAYRDAARIYRSAVRGMLVNDSVRTAILLTTGALWEHRGDEVELEGMPQAAKTFLWPFRLGVGV